MRKKAKAWYSAKCIFVHEERIGGPRQLFEERVILVRAKRFNAVATIARRRAKVYAKSLPGCSFLACVDVFELFGRLKDGAEVFSAMQQSDLSPSVYLDQHYPGFPDDREADGLEHRFYNKGKGYSACYHCKVERPGELWKDTSKSRI